MKFLIYSSVTFVVLAGSNGAFAGFSGSYQPQNWSIYTDGGSIDTAVAPDWISITSSDDQSGELNKYQQIIITAVYSGQVSFNWRYDTLDIDGPSNDDFGWLLNGEFSLLSDPDGDISQAGSFVADIVAGDIFGFRIYSLDSLGGASTALISQFSAPGTSPAPEPIPIPTVAWMLLLPMVATLRLKPARA
ncbi:MULTISPECIES: hypothetical protein [Methylomonas]|uniref:hypothetical protein n=1 Tax=Methylomonas TaxID=416 RepID=UPI001231C375|nr:hypothetical protein [Methylomonas rhizoryzae]